MDNRNIPTYNLFRARIEDNKHLLDIPGMTPDDSHVISIGCMINGDKWSSNIIPIKPYELKEKVKFLKGEIIRGANHHNKGIVVTSIGN